MSSEKNYDTMPRIKSVIKKKCRCSIDLSSSNDSDTSCAHSSDYITMVASIVNDKTLVDGDITISNDNSYCSEIANIQSSDNDLHEHPTEENLSTVNHSYEIMKLNDKTSKTSDDTNMELNKSVECLNNFSDILEIWRRYEQDCPKQNQEQNCNKENSPAETPYENNCKLTYEDLSSTLNKKHFKSLLKDWNLKTNNKNPYFTSTPMSPIENNSSINLSTIYDYDVVQRVQEYEQKIQHTNNICKKRTVTKMGTDMATNNTEVVNSTMNSQSIFGDLDCSISITSKDLIFGNSIKPNSTTSQEPESSLSNAQMENSHSSHYNSTSDKDEVTKMQRCVEEKDYSSHTLSTIDSNPESPKRRYVQKDDPNKTTCNKYKPNAKNRLSKVNSSVATHDLSSLVSTGASYYTDEEFRRHSMQHVSPLSDNFRMDRAAELEMLRDEIRNQNEVVHQVSKALYNCKKSNKWNGSRERAEAEKILLIATIKNTALLTALSCSDENKRDSYLGSMKVSDIKFTLNSRPENNNFYLCIITSGTQVKASKIIEPLGKMLCFNEVILLEKLSPESEVFLMLYSLKIKNTGNNGRNYKSKLHKTLNKILMAIACYEEDYSNVERTMTSDFQLVGQSNLSKYVMKEVKHLYITNNKITLTVGDVFEASIELKINFESEVAGYINLGKEISNITVWTRRWCRLKDMEIKYYNYPGEEQTSNTVGNIDLQYLNGEITCPKYEVLMRSKTVKFAIANQPDHSDCIYYLTPDSFKEFKEWQYRLYNLVENMRRWKCLKN